MKIVIETDGSYDGTIISFNGEKLLPPKVKIVDFHLGLHPKSNVKMTAVKVDPISGKGELLSMYGTDFKKYDEINILAKEIPIKP